jgi:hypothetical protein
MDSRRGGRTAGQGVNGGESACTPDSVLGTCVPGAAIPLGRRLPAGSSGLPGGLRRAGSPPPVWPCSGWGLPSRPGHPGRWCALTAPFHPCLCGLPPSAVCFLWHCPAGHPDWLLTSTLPCGVRTFLGPVTAGTRPPGRLTTNTHSRGFLRHRGTGASWCRTGLHQRRQNEMALSSGTQPDARSTASAQRSREPARTASGVAGPTTRPGWNSAAVSASSVQTPVAMPAR